MNTTSEVSTRTLLVTKQQFTAHNSKPKDGKGLVNFHFEDNRKDCLCEPNDSVCWQASLTLKAFSSTDTPPDPAKDLLLMEAIISVEGQFIVKPLDSATDLQSLAGYFDEVCKLCR